MIVTVEDILAQIPFGKMQYYLIAFHFMMFVTTSFIAFNYSFFLMYPMYNCTWMDPYDSSQSYVERCSKEQICASPPLPNLRQWDIDWSSSYSLQNWMHLLDLHCSTSFEIGLFGSLYFAGYLTACAIFPPLADKYGRKIFIILVCVFQTLCLGLMILIPNTTLYYVLNFALGTQVPLK